MKIQDTTLEEKKIKPTLGFIGIGWIGLNRMNAIRKQNIIFVDALCDVQKENLRAAVESAPEAKTYESIEELLIRRPAGVVIATPSALHAEQAIYALEKGVSVFCQKPLARTSKEARQVVEAARKNNKLLGVDLSYRYTQGMQRIFSLVQSDSLGKIFAVHLIFHNAYGPDKSWFYNPTLSGGGCVIDLGIHMIDLALWTLNFPRIRRVSSVLHSNGKVVTDADMEIEDYANAIIETEDGVCIDLSCSWNLQAGQDARIEATFHGTKGGATFQNVDGSFFDFEAFHFFSKTKKEIISSPPDDWGGRAAIDWAKRLSVNASFNNAEAEQYIRVAEVIDRIYNR